MSYVLTLHALGPEVNEASYSTVDTAITEARRAHRRLGLNIYVLEIAAARRVRGVVEEGVYHWIDACPKCAGAGVLQRRHPTIPSLVQPTECSRCRGEKFVKEVRS